MYNLRFVGFLQMNTNTSGRSMLVLYPASAVVSSVVSACFVCELILKVHKISVFKECTLVHLLWKSQIIKIPLPSELQS